MLREPATASRTQTSHVGVSAQRVCRAHRPQVFNSMDRCHVLPLIMG